MGYEGRTVTFEWRNQRPEAFGYKFKSKQEYRWAQYLEIICMSNLRTGELGWIGWRYEPRTFKAKKMRWNRLRNYTPDFSVSVEEAFDYIHIEWHEVKTSLTQMDVTRFKWFKADYPEERIVLVLNSQPKKNNFKQIRLLENARKYVDDVIFAGPIFRKLGL